MTLYGDVDEKNISLDAQGRVIRNWFFTSLAPSIFHALAAKQGINTFVNGYRCWRVI